MKKGEVGTRARAEGARAPPLSLTSGGMKPMTCRSIARDSQSSVERWAMYSSRAQRWSSETSVIRPQSRMQILPSGVLLRKGGGGRKSVRE
jgi:hypothetical protein